MSAPVRMDQGERIRQNVAAMRAQGASDDDVHAYLVSAGAQPVDTTAKALPAAPAMRGDTTADVQRSNVVEQGVKRQHRDAIPDYGGRDVNTGLVGKVLSSATMGLAPKGLAAIDALRDAVNGASAGMPFRETMARAYNDNLNARNASNAQASRESPVLSFGAEALGSLVNPVNRLVGMIGGAPTTALGRMGASAAQGAALGAGYGAGGAEWRGPNGLQNAATGAGVGALVGGLTGGAVSGGTEAASALRTVLRARAASPATTAGRVVPGLTRQDVAAEKVLGVLDEAGVPLEGLAGRASDAPLMLGELAGNPGVRALRAVQTVGGKGANAVERSLKTRQQGALGRVSGALEDASGTGGKDAIQLADDVRAAQKAAAKPNYDEAYGYGAIKDPETVAAVNDLFNLPEGAGKAWKRAYKAGRRVAAQDPASNLAATGSSKLTDMGLPIEPTVRDLDLMKQGIDALVEKGTNGKGISRADAKFMRQRLNGLMERVDAEVPAYAKARSAFKGDAEFLDAIDAGKAFVGEDARVVQKTLGSMSPSEQEAYRVGATDELLRRMRSAPDAADVVKQVFGSTEKRDALRSLFPDEAKYRAFTRTMMQEAKAANTKQVVLGGSQTANKMNDADMFGDALLSTVLPANVIGASPPGIALRALGHGRQAMDRLAGQALASDVGDMLRTRTNDPEAMQRVMALLQSTVAKRAARGTASRIRSGRLGGAAADAALNP